MSTVDSFGAKSTLTVGGTDYEIYRIDTVAGYAQLPFSLKVLLENLLRTEDGANVTKSQIEALGNWDAAAEPDTEIQFTPARVVMQDFTGVPCIVDLATMREAVAELGGDPTRLAVAGDSAGGNISAVMALRARDAGGPALKFQLLWYPVATGDVTLPSFTENADAPMLNSNVTAAFLAWYLPGMDLTDASTLPTDLAPANAESLEGLPPAYIGTAEHDPLRDDGAHYAKLLAAAGVPVELSNEPTMVHGFVSLALASPVATEATNRGLAALKAALYA